MNIGEPRRIFEVVPEKIVKEGPAPSEPKPEAVPVSVPQDA